MKKLSLIIILILLLVSCHNVQESDDSSKNSYISTEKNIAESLNKLNQFSIKSSEIYFQEKWEENAVFSPLSFFFQLALLQSLSKNATSKELLSAISMNSSEIKNVASFYKNNRVFYNETIEETIEGKLEASEEGFFGMDNSIWMNQKYTIKTSGLSQIINTFNANIYKTNFDYLNENLGKYIQNFMKNIDIPLPEIDSSSLLTIMNLLLLKDVWSTGALKESVDSYDFNDKKMKMLIGNYEDGMVYEEESFKSFYITTKNGYKLTFVVPKESHTLNEVFHKEKLEKIVSATYKTSNNDVYYKTRCIFPEFRISSSESLKDVCKSMGISEIFLPTSEYIVFDDKGNFINDIKQNIYLDVNKNGIDAGAITYSSIFGNPSKKIEYNDFIIDRSFGFMITELDTDILLFSGTIHNI